jgi:hypothetical protein
MFECFNHDYLSFSKNSASVLQSTPASLHLHACTPALTCFLFTHVDLVLQSPLVSQLGESLERLLQGDKLAHLLSGRIVPVADVDGAGFLFLGADDWFTQANMSAMIF